MRTATAIARRISRLRSREYRLRRIFILMSEFKSLYAELAPIYQKRYGGMLVDREAHKDGYHSISFQDVAVCLKKEV